MNTISLTTALLLGWVGANGASIKVPNELANVEGNSAALEPFTAPVVGGTNPPSVLQYYSMRYQQICDASQFPEVKPEGEFVTGVYFRLDSQGGSSYNSFVILRDVEISLSTTSKTPDGLSTNFAENVGSDATVVFPRGQFESHGFWTPGYSPQTFGMGFETRPWFFYKPSAGNLLLDVKVFTYSNSFPVAWLDASQVTGDSVSRLFATNVASTAGVADTRGLVMWFPIWTPSISVLRSNQTLRLLWGQGIEGFNLETATNLGPDASWTLVAEPVVTNGAIRQVVVPIQADEVLRCYRLRWTPPPKALEGDLRAPEAILPAAGGRERPSRDPQLVGDSSDEL